MKPQRRWAPPGSQTPDKLCPLGCGAAFYTNVGLVEHARLGCSQGHASPVRVRRAWRMTARRAAALRERGREVTAVINAKRFRCGECDVESNPGPLALHQRATGHAGRTELA